MGLGNPEAMCARKGESHLISIADNTERALALGVIGAGAAVGMAVLQTANVLSKAADAVADSRPVAKIITVLGGFGTS